MLDRTAMQIPAPRLLDELEARIAQRKARQAELDARYGAGRIRLRSYMENIGWPELFGYEMQRYFDDSDFAVEQFLRQQIFWTDNVADDTLPSTCLSADVGMYWDMTLFGQEIRHTAIGVPEFLPHQFQQGFDPGTLVRFDFHETGVMPRLIAKYRRLREIVSEEYGGRLTVGFPSFHRGPLDVYVQLRGYENFLEDVADRPDECREVLLYLVEERRRFAHERSRFLGEAALPPTTFVADDWVNVPFISPAMFRGFVVPLYRRIRENEGPVTGFHTCGNMMPVVEDLLAAFPEMESLDVTSWNDIRVVDERVAPRVQFNRLWLPTFFLSTAHDEHRRELQAVAAVAKRRRVAPCAAAVTNLHSSYETTLGRLADFVVLAREVWAGGSSDR